MARETQQLTINCHLISVATGSLAWQIINAVSCQYPDLKIELTTHTFVDTEKRLRSALKKVRGKNSWIFHALLDPDMKKEVNEFCRRREIPGYDMTSGIMRFFTKHGGLQPSIGAGIELDEGYFKRLDALEFTLQHDDSRRLDSLAKADIVIVGLSRVSKTPTSCYLGTMGFKVANVSLVPEIGLPPELKRSMRKKVVAFTIQPKRLQEIRARRMVVNKFDEHLNEEEFSYLNLRSIIREVMAAERLYREREFPIVNITDQTVEATAVTVLETLGLKRKIG